MEKRFRRISRKVVFSPALESSRLNDIRLASEEDFDPHAETNTFMSPDQIQKVKDTWAEDRPTIRGIHHDDIEYARKSGVSIDDLLDAHSWNKGDGPTMVSSTYDSLHKKRIPWAYDRHLNHYILGRINGFTHDELKDAHESGLKDLYAYTRARKPDVLPLHLRGGGSKTFTGDPNDEPQKVLSHEEVMNKFKIDPDSFKPLKEQGTMSPKEARDHVMNWNYYQQQERDKQDQSEIDRITKQEYLSNTPEEHQALIHHAIQNKHELEMDYTSAADKKRSLGLPSKRTVIPSRMRWDPTYKSLKMDAYDINQNAWREYNLPRIHGIISSKPRRFEPPEEELNDSGGTAGGNNGIPTEFSVSGEILNKPEFAWSNDDHRGVWKDNGTLPRPWIGKDHLRAPRSYDVEPTESEYKEIQGMDIDPDTFDRATYKRLRNYGVTHNECKDALLNIDNKTTPLEDYETALKSSQYFIPSEKGGKVSREFNHVKVRDDAHAYQKHYEDIINKNRTFDVKDHLQPSQHDALVNQLFFHHTTLKNMPEDQKPSVFPATSWSGRANEWIANDMTKLDPTITKNYEAQVIKQNPDIKDVPNVFKNKKIQSDKFIMNADQHDNAVNNLLRHYNNKLVGSRTVKEYMVNNRKLNLVNNAASSHYLPTEYEHDKYQESYV